MKYYNQYKTKSFKYRYILKQYRYNLNAGDIVAGIIKYQEVKGFLIDIGTHISGYLPETEINLTREEDLHYIKYYIYTNREFFLITYNTDYKKSIVSIKRLEYIRAWKRIQQLILEDIIFNLQVKKINKGGIITNLENLQAFIPNSHLYPIKKIIPNNSIKKNIKCKILMINTNKNEIILSQKSALLHLSLHKFRLGEITYGIIVNIQNYGIFIDIYGILGLLHISEISLLYINNIYNIFHIGKLIKIKIIHINKNQGKLSVSSKNIRNKLH